MNRSIKNIISEWNSELFKHTENNEITQCVINYKHILQRFLRIFMISNNMTLTSWLISLIYYWLSDENGFLFAKQIKCKKKSIPQNGFQRYSMYTINIDFSYVFSLSKWLWFNISSIIDLEIWRWPFVRSGNYTDNNEQDVLPRNYIKVYFCNHFINLFCWIFSVRSSSRGLKICSLWRWSPFSIFRIFSPWSFDHEVII